MTLDSSKMGFAYKYPFSNEAKEIVLEQPNAINIKYLDMAGRQLESTLQKGGEYNEISLNSIRLDYVMTYLYSRMLLSALKRADLVKSFAVNEAKRSAQAMEGAEINELVKVGSALGISLTGTFDKRKDSQGIEELSISFIDYIKYAPKIPAFELVNQKLSSGIVLLNRNNMIKLLEQATIKNISKGLPIKITELPKEVIDYSKSLKLRPVASITVKVGPGKKSEEWIEKLLQTPIADVRHRTVNLILAPYLVNVKGYEPEQAVKIIVDYIEKCKEIDPSTRVNESYIRYQCVYAKRKGLKTLSLEKAKELLGSQVDLEAQITTKSV